MSPPATNSLIFCLSANIFISLSFLKDSFAIYRILGWVFFFPLSFLSTLFHYLLVPTVLRRQLLILLWLTLQITSCFSLAVFFKEFSLSFSIFNDSSICESLACILFGIWASWRSRLTYLIKWKLYSSYFFNASSAPLSLLSFWFSHHAYVSVLNRDPYFSEVLFIFLHFSLCSLDYIISIDLFSACSNLLLSPTSKFFSAVFANSRISIWFLYFKISIFY